MRRTLLALALTTLVAAAPAAHAARPTPAQTIAAADALGVGVQARKLQDHFLPGARLIATHGHAALGATRLGGAPDLPKATKWPTCNHHPLTFLGQLALRDVRTAVPDTTRGTGLLSIFIGTRVNDHGLLEVQDLYSASRTQLARLAAHSCVRVIHTRSTGRRTLHRGTAPRGIGAFPAAPQRLRPTLTVPDELLARDHFGVQFPRNNRWLGLQMRAAWGILAEDHASPPFAQVLGWSMPLLDDVSLRRCAGQPARLLWQIDSDDTYNMDDGAAGFLMIAVGARDLRAGRFDRLCGEDQID